MQTFAIVTTTPNELVGKVHDRLPVLLPREQEQRWLTTTGAGELMVPPMTAYDAGAMRGYEVSRKVSNARFDMPGAVEEVGRQLL